MKSTTDYSDPMAHEKLDCYRLAVDVARWASRLNIPAFRKHLRDQVTRAADSMVLNLAEGLGTGVGETRRHHLRIVAGSAAEVMAVIDLLEPDGGEARKAELRRIVIMARRLERR